MGLPKLLLVCALACFSYTAHAGPPPRHHHGHKDTHEYWDGHCKVKREYKKNGRYKEKRDCRPQARHSPPRHRHHSDNQYSSGIHIPAIIIEPIIRIGR